MASVTSLDKDLRQLRLDKYTPSAANQVRSWIESILGERLPGSDLLEGLKDGVALCKLINLAVSPGVRFKQSAMPFVQMENISLFLRACQSPPLNLPDHDMFLTVDLYEQKDPTQVLQCLGAFSRAANSVNPAAFPTAIGPKANRGVLSPQSTGPASPSPTRDRGMSIRSNTSSALGSSRPPLTASKTGDSGSGRWSPTKSPVNATSWSKKNQEGVTSPAWNIAQYGYMGGASQGNLGIAFGGRRQITTAGPHVPSRAEKERLRKAAEEEAERQRIQMEEEEAIRKAEIEAEEERARLEEERRWEEETKRQREEEKRKAEEEKRRWEEEERRWRETNEKRRMEEEEAEKQLAEERRATRTKSDARLQGQFLSQYRAEQDAQDSGGYGDRVRELEKELERAREREREYEEERQRRVRKPGDSKARARSRSRPPSRQDSWSRDEREYLRTQWDQQQVQDHGSSQASPPQPSRSSRPLPEPTAMPAPINTHRTGERLPQPPVKSHRTGEQALPPPVKSHRTGEQAPPPPVKSHRTGESRPLPVPDRISSNKTGGSRPLPVPHASKPVSYSSNRTDRYLASNAPPQGAAVQQTYSRELGATAERDAEDRRRAQSQQKTKAGGWASKSLLEREMEMERQRQKEWEDAQKETAQAVRSNDGVEGIGGGIGGRWDVGQWSGYTGGDSQNRGNQGIGSGRRQIVGPRPLPGRP